MPTAPTTSPVPTVNTVECLFEIETDNFPSELGWIVTATDTDEQVHEVLAGEYELDFTAYATTLELQVGVAYQLTLADSHGDGFQGNFTICYGDEDDVCKVLLRYDPFLSDNFSSQLTMDFVVTECATIQVFPTVSPTTAAPTPSPGPHPPCNVCGSSGEVYHEL